MSRTRMRIIVDDLPLKLETDAEFVTLCWDTEAMGFPVSTYVPGVVWERNPESNNERQMAYARIYDRFHDEPMITVAFNSKGRATHMLIRHFPDVGRDVEIAPAGYTDEEAR